MLDYKEKIKVIGFDLDQTLYEKSPEIDRAIQGYLFKKIAQFRNCSLEEAEKLFKELYKDGAGLSGTQSMKALGLENASEITQEALENAEIDKFLIPNRETIGLLGRIKEKYKNLDLLTGSGEAIAEKKLKKLEIDRSLFGFCVFDGDAKKSDGTAYELWLKHYEKEGFQPENFLYIGDRPKSDYFVPSPIGIAVVLVNVSKNDPEIKCPQLAKLGDLEELLF